MEERKWAKGWPVLSKPVKDKSAFQIPYHYLQGCYRINLQGDGRLVWYLSSAGWSHSN